jgi:cell division protein FtsW
MSKLGWLLTFAIAMIFLLGLLMIFSTTSAEVLDHALNKSTHLAPIRQIFYGFCGIALSYLTYRIGYQRLIDYSPQILLALTVMLVLVLIPGIGKEVNGSKRWLNILGISFQPSEFVKFFVPAFFIHRFLPLQESKPHVRDFLKIVGLIAIPMALIMIEPNNGTTAVVGAALLAVFFLMRVPIRFWALPLGISLFAGILFASQLPYAVARINVYLHPELDLKGKGHQPYQAKIAAGSGQFWGRGPGNSLQKMSYLPEAQNDYIAAIYAEEWGFLGIICLIALYMTAVFAGFSIAFKAEARSGLYMGGVIAFLLGLQAFLNMGVVSGLLPSTGLNLPFFSQGGTSLMANMAGIGILLSIRK